jgi:hypothetical protein
LTLNNQLECSNMWPAHPHPHPPSPTRPRSSISSSGTSFLSFAALSAPSLPVSPTAGRPLQLFLRALRLRRWHLTFLALPDARTSSRGICRSPSSTCRRPASPGNWARDPPLIFWLCPPTVRMFFANARLAACLTATAKSSASAVTGCFLASTGCTCSGSALHLRVSCAAIPLTRVSTH